MTPRTHIWRSDRTILLTDNDSGVAHTWLQESIYGEVVGHFYCVSVLPYQLQRAGPSRVNTSYA